jgi:glycine hydroxymethyltransferase
VEGAKHEAEFIRTRVQRHNEWFRDSIPLIASENVMCPLAKEMMISDFADRYAEGLPGKRYYEGNLFVDEVEEKVMALGEHIFKSRLADPRPISGTVANMAALFALAEPGDLISSPNLQDGAHISTAKFGAVGMRGLRSVNYPFDEAAMNIDVDGAAKLIRKEKPKVCQFGMSLFLFPVPLKELRPAIEEVGARCWYDGAHVLGLIAGGQFQDPLREGADVVTGSTHKTFPGPQHGILLSNSKDDDLLKKLRSRIFPGVVSNHHLHAMAALGITMAEWLEFGEAYAKQIVKNSRALAEALNSEGFKVLGETQGFTRSHQVAIDVRPQGGGAPISKLFESCNMITNKNLLPADRDRSPQDPSGVRVGVQECTRLGMKESEMKEVARLMARAALKGEAPARVKESVVSFKRGFTTVQYCSHAGFDAYKYHKLT